MTTPEPTDGPERDAGDRAGDTARLILEATERASERIMAATERAVKTITDALVAVPTALSTPPPQMDTEAIVAAFEKIQNHGYHDNLINGSAAGPFYPGPGDLDYDPRVDTLVDEMGRPINTGWSVPPGGETDPLPPDPNRPLFDTGPPGATLIPQLPDLT